MIHLISLLVLYSNPQNVESLIQTDSYFKKLAVENTHGVIRHVHQILMHGKDMTTAVNPSEYLVSEKLDGIRAYWDGYRFWTKQGNLLTVPAYITNSLPPIPLDGELWLGRERFHEVMRLIQNNDLTDPAWHQLKYAVFDLPEQKTDFASRYLMLQKLFKLNTEINKHSFLIEQRVLNNNDQVKKALSTVVEQGGEGLVLHRKDNLYQPGRTSSILKVKPTYQIEGTVIGYKGGQGKYLGMTGSLKVKYDGQVFFVGSGLTNEDRNNPPKIGSPVCIEFSGFTHKGIPRFPRYKKECDDIQAP